MEPNIPKCIKCNQVLSTSEFNEIVTKPGNSDTALHCLKCYKEENKVYGYFNKKKKDKPESPTLPRCKAKIGKGDKAHQCTSRSHPNYPGYCKKHDKEFYKENPDGHKYCESKYDCDKKRENGQWLSEDDVVRETGNKQMHCEPCRKRAREYDNTHHAKDIYNDKNQRQCIECKDFFDAFEFENDKKIRRCFKCRETQAEKDKLRDRGDRKEQYKAYHQSEHGKEVESAWKKNNPDKLTEYWQKHRGKDIAELGVDEYHKRNTERHHDYVDRHKEELDKYNEDYNKKRRAENLINEDIERLFKMRKGHAETNNKPWKLTLEEFITLIKLKKCCYCLDVWATTLDRCNSQQGYTIENCVPCCFICNMLKGCLSPEIFIKRCQHIAKFKGFVDNPNFELDYQLFGEHERATYSQYMHRASIKGFEFVLSNDQYNTITHQMCYICGNKNFNTIGMDRIDNSKGYIVDNLEPCCSECNYFKRDFTLDVVYDKITKIAQAHPEKIIIIDYSHNKRIEENGLNVSKEEKEKRKEEVKKRKTQHLLDKYNVKLNYDNTDDAGGDNDSNNIV